MIYRDVSCEIVHSVDIHACWRWAFILRGRRQSGQTKISRRAAEIQAHRAIDRALGRPVQPPLRRPNAGALSNSIVESFKETRA
jgi:hypothetical protein